MLIAIYTNHSSIKLPLPVSGRQNTAGFALRGRVLHPVIYYSPKVTLKSVSCYYMIIQALGGTAVQWRVVCYAFMRWGFLTRINFQAIPLFFQSIRVRGHMLTVYEAKFSTIVVKTRQYLIGFEIIVCLASFAGVIIQSGRLMPFEFGWNNQSMERLVLAFVV